MREIEIERREEGREGERETDRLALVGIFAFDLDHQLCLELRARQRILDRLRALALPPSLSLTRRVNVCMSWVSIGERERDRERETGM